MAELMTVQQIAENKGVTERTVRNWIASCEIDPEMLQEQERGGKPVPWYDLDRMESALSVRIDISLASKMSDTGKLKFMTGSAVVAMIADGDDEQFIDACAFLDTLLPGLGSAMNDKIQDILFKGRVEACGANQERFKIMRLYDKLIDNCPDKYLDDTQLSRKRATTETEWDRRFTKITGKRY